MRVGCIIQARLGSTRLPKKALADIGGWPMIRHVYERMCQVGIPVVVAVPEEDEAELARYGRIAGVQGDPNDVLQRYLTVAKIHSFDAVMRVTGDCPLIDPEACKRVLNIFNSGHYDYVANDVRPSYPDGLGCEVFTRSALEDANRWAKPQNKGDREHVTEWIKRGLDLNGGRWFCGLNLRCPITGIQDLKFSVNTQEDLDRVRLIDARLPPGHLKYALETTLEAWERVKEASDKTQ